MNLTATVPLTQADEPCTDDVMNDWQANFPGAPQNLVQPDTYGSLIIWLRLAAGRHDAIKLLTNSAAAFFLAHPFVQRPQSVLATVFGGDDRGITNMLRMFAPYPPLDDGFATAFADLAVTGRQAFASFSKQMPSEANLVPLVVARLASAGISVTPADITAWATMALDRAYTVAHAVRGPAADRVAMRTTLKPKWVAVSGEDDSPDRPVNVTSAPYPQGVIPVTMGAVTVQTRFFVASPDPLPPTSSPPLRSLPAADPIAIPSGPDDRVLLFIHGHGSSAEEALRLVAPLQAEGAAVGLRVTVIAFDLPNNGYSTPMFDHNTVAPSAATTYPGGIFDHGPINTPILDFIENAIVGFVNALDAKAPFIGRCAGVMGGSLGGNMGLRLGRRDPAAFPWLRNGIAAWSPAGVWAPMVQDEIKRVGPDHCRNKWDEPEQYGLTANGSSRKNYFIETYTGNAINADGSAVTDTLGLVKVIGVALGAVVGAVIFAATGGLAYLVVGTEYGALIGLLTGPSIAGPVGSVAQANEWYREDWKPCYAFMLLEGSMARKEIYNTFYRQWNWRVAGEQLIFSHVDRVDRESPTSPFRYQLNRIRTLLASGAKDNFPHTNIFEATQILAGLMTQLPGLSLFLDNTGHSIHIERPKFFAREIVSFLLPPTGVATPTINVDGTVAELAVAADIIDGTPGATIYYTLDGADPTRSSNLYGGQFDIGFAQRGDTVTVKAIAVAPGWADSAIASLDVASP